MTTYKKGSSVGSTDIDTEPEGMQNGTAPLQTSFSEKVVYNRHTTDAQPAETEGLSQDEKQNGTSASSSMVKPTSTSNGKGTAKDVNNQTSEQKNAPQPKKKVESKHEKKLKEMGIKYNALEEFVLRNMGGGKTKFRWKARQSGTGGLGTHTTGEGARGDMHAKASMFDAANCTTFE